LATKNLAMWTSDRSQISVTYSDVNGAISAVNWNVIAGYTVVVTLHQLNPPKPDIGPVAKSGPDTNSQNVGNGYNLVLGTAKQGWHWPGDVIDYSVSEGPTDRYDPQTHTFR
jgi:hypothetical protein